MSTFDALIFIAEITVVLYLLWRFLDLAFSALERWHTSEEEE